jgi:hypothetical protein
MVMKYRILNNDELKHLEEELKQFLIVNGVHAEEWEQINKHEPEKALQLVQLFSDNVLEKVYDRIKVLEFRSLGSCMVFHFEDNKIELISVQRKSGSDVDLSTPENIHRSLIHFSDHLTFFKIEKKYSLDRNREIHQMVEQGCYVSSISFWNALLDTITVISD